MRKLLSAAAFLLPVLAATTRVFADTSKGTAENLKLEKTTGTVNITKDGKAVTVKAGIHLYEGYTVQTGAGSSAYISLDANKAVMLEASTTAAIKKSGKKLDIMLQNGSIQQNAEKKLASEGIDIRTTNSVTGTRG